MTAESVLAAKTARKSAHVLQSANASDKSLALDAIYKALESNKEKILVANARDLAIARKRVTEGSLSDSLVKRLDLTLPGKWESLLEGILQVKTLEDPTRKVQLATRLDDGLNLYRVSCPIGVLLIIFEARPEVVVQISCLAIKSGNAVLLKGGKEATETNAALFSAIHSALSSLSSTLHIPPSAVQLVETRDEISTLLQLDAFIDLVIPRGSKSLVQFIKENTRIPVMGHADGLCSVYIDEFADAEKVVPLVIDSKTNYPAACNSAETLLVHSKVAPKLLSSIAQNLFEKNVIIKACPVSYPMLKSCFPNQTLLQEASDADFDTEFLCHTMALKVIEDFESAITHINTHGSKHTDMIVTEDSDRAKRFMDEIDAAGVYWNASTRFADGFRYGFGAEIGVSTNKIHARGPVGLEGLVIYKYKLFGQGQTVSSYGPGKKEYVHQPILPVSSVSEESFKLFEKKR